MKFKAIKRLTLTASLAFTLFGCSSNPNTPTNNTNTSSSLKAPVDPNTAQVASVDRFNDNFAKLFKRSAPGFDPANVSKVLPTANTPIDMDKLFLVKSLGPRGEKVVYYALDVNSDIPVTGYNFVDASGNSVSGQLPVVTTLPNDSGYTDFVKFTQVQVKSDYKANSITSKDDIDAAVKSGDVTIKDTDHIENWAFVPKGTTATYKFQGNPVSGYTAWYKGQVASFLKFDTNLQAIDGKVPTSPVVVIFNNGKDPSMGFKAEADGQTHNVLATLPGDPGYSSLWIHNVQGKPEGFDSVKDYPTAIANQSGPLGVDVNCPVVSQ